MQARRPLRPTEFGDRGHGRCRQRRRQGHALLQVFGPRIGRGHGTAAGAQELLARQRQRRTLEGFHGLRLGNAAAGQQQHVLRHGLCVLLVVRAHQHGRALGHLAQQLQQHEGLVALKLCRGLVHHQQGRLGQRLAQDGHGTLLHGDSCSAGWSNISASSGKPKACTCARHQSRSACGTSLRRAGPARRWRRRCWPSSAGPAAAPGAAPAWRRSIPGPRSARCPSGESADWRREIGQRAQRRGLARAAGAQQGRDAVGGQREVHLSQDDARAERCAQTRRLQAVVLLQSMPFLFCHGPLRALLPETRTVHARLDGPAV